MQKKWIFAGSVVIMLVCCVLAVTQVSCSKDACAKVTCQNGGSCLNGTCSCPTGYSGTNCQTPYSAAFVGTYVGSYTDSANSAHTADNFVVTTDTGAYGIIITDSVAGLTFKGIIKNDTLNIPAQTITFTHFTAIVSGNGTANLPVISINYTETIGANVVNISFNGNIK